MAQRGFGPTYTIRKSLASKYISTLRGVRGLRLWTLTAANLPPRAASRSCNPEALEDLDQGATARLQDPLGLEHRLIAKLALHSLDSIQWIHRQDNP